MDLTQLLPTNARQLRSISRPSHHLAGSRQKLEQGGRQTSALCCLSTCRAIGFDMNGSRVQNDSILRGDSRIALKTVDSRAGA